MATREEIKATETIGEIKELIEEYADCRKDQDSLKVAVQIYYLAQGRRLCPKCEGDLDGMREVLKEEHQCYFSKESGR